ncbi:HAD-IA family hydrolase [Psychromonas sp. KJ10-10]|uniref:HAD-IA family hydrolase n=1 Tax=Psychromonas sp. KJ10-10 TaxID=3391823 RepID=UPI0039B50FF1
MIKCIIFDCDGTLVDSEYLCNLGFEIKLKEYGVHFPAQQIMEKHVGSKLAGIMASFESEFGIKLKEDFVSSYRAIVAELFKERLTACDGVHEMLSSINLPKCVASNGPLEKMTMALTLSGLIEHFQGHLFSAYEVGSWKPDPGLFLEVANVMGFKAEQCAVVEDSLVGLVTAKAAGMFAILYDPHNIHNELPDTLRISHMDQLLDSIS